MDNWQLRVANVWTIVFAILTAGTLHVDAREKSIAESIRIYLQPDRVARIETPWGQYVAYDRGVESVPVYTPHEFDEIRRHRGFDAPVKPTSSDISVALNGVILSHVLLDVMYDVDAKATQRPELPPGMSYVSMEWQPAVSVNPLVFLVDLQTGAVARCYFSGTTEDVGTEEFLFPASSIMHRTLVIFFNSKGRPSAIAVRSIAWLTVRDYDSGQDLWEHEAHKLIQKDSSLRSAAPSEDIDLKRFNEQLKLSSDGPIKITIKPAPGVTP